MLNQIMLIRTSVTFYSGFIVAVHLGLGSPTASRLINNLFLSLSLKALLKKNITRSRQSKLQRCYVSVRCQICLAGTTSRKKIRVEVFWWNRLSY